MKKVFIVAGDPSGDIISSQLVKAMKLIKPDLSITGLGGKHLSQVSDRSLGNIVKQHALGFAISPRKIVTFYRILKNVVDPEFKNNPPDVVIPVDFYGFNSRVAKLAKQRGIPVFYYVSPQFWASRPGRADRLRQSVDLFLCLFPFEVEFYKKKNLPAQFVGHPLLDKIPAALSASASPQRIESNLGLLPGSRPEEIKNHLPVMLEGCDLIAQQHPALRTMLFTVPHVSRHLYHDIIHGRGKRTLRHIEMVEDENYRWRSQLDLCITASGMETLENTLLGIPMVVIYKTNWITYTVARALIQIRHLALPNLLSKEAIVPEFIQGEAVAQSIAQPILTWLRDPLLRKETRQKLLALRTKLGEDGASHRAAQAIFEKVA